MKNNPNITLLGLGYKARNGKDSVANFLSNKLPDVKIIHWADGVYEECRNEDTSYPLIIQEVKTESKIWYSFLDDKDVGSRRVLSHKQVPYIHKIFSDRDITTYRKMDGKDPEILQFWGTNFRRKFCDMNYWVGRTFKKINELLDSTKFIIIPDTRFINEVEAIHDHNGLYIKVMRTHADGSAYIANDRDPNHASEIELENYPADFTISAINLTELEKEVDDFIIKLQA